MLVGAPRNAVWAFNAGVSLAYAPLLVSKEETCAEILEDIYYGAAKVIQREAGNNIRSDTIFC